MTEYQVLKFLENNLGEVLSTCLKYQGAFKSKGEFRLSNGIQVDLAALDSSNRVVGLFEAKGSVGINDLVKGIGQVFQYQNHVDKKLEYDYAPKAKSFLVIPIDVYRRLDFRKFKFPKGTGIILVDPKQNTFLLLGKKKIKQGMMKNIKIISPYYVRDNRLGEIYLGLKTIETLSPRVKTGKLKMAEVKEQLKKIIKNKGNARNIGITLRGLGFIDRENRLTAEGQRHLRMTYEDFCKKLALNQLAPFLNLIMIALVEIALEKGNNLNKIILDNLEELRQKIISHYGQNVLYVTDSKTRYISSWMNILKEDLGAVSFKPGSYSQGIKINYFPTEGLPFHMEKIPVSPRARKYEYVSKGLNILANL